MNKRKIFCLIVGHKWAYIDRYLYPDIERCWYCDKLQRVKNPTPDEKNDYHWDAFCTIHWFATGRKIVRFTPDETTHNMYNWWLELQEKEDAISVK